MDAAARALARRAVATSGPTEPADGWRRVGRILEASRLALAAGPEEARAFFASRWAADELAHAGSILRAAGVADATWTRDVHRRPIDDEAAANLLERLDALLSELG